MLCWQQAASVCSKSMQAVYGLTVHNSPPLSPLQDLLIKFLFGNLIGLAEVSANFLTPWMI